MCEFLLLFRGTGAYATEHSLEAMQENMQRWIVWMASLQREGKFIGAQPLKETGKIISASKKNCFVRGILFLSGKQGKLRVIILNHNSDCFSKKLLANEVVCEI